MDEIWGTTVAQIRYKHPSDLVKLLGNIQPGDSMRFKGRSPIQNTGCFNNKMYGTLLHVVFVDLDGERSG
jgi:hypothetical protein